MASTTVLITGAKAGIGKALLEAYALRSQHTVIAAIRDTPDSEVAQKLASLPVGQGSKIILAQYDAASPTAADELVATLKTKHYIRTLDIVIANAGILRHSALIKNSSADDFIDHFRVNTVGPIMLYKATSALLNASKQTPKFLIISSALGSNGLMDNFSWPLSAYSTSKAAVNWVAGKIHREEERIVVIPQQPGWVQTTMGERAAEYNGMDKSEVPVRIEDSVKNMLAIWDKATKEESGRFWDQNGVELPW